MLEFFRRYQKVFFVVITVVIIISFSFFGTYQAISGRDVVDHVAIRAIDGSKVYSLELNDMVTFLSHDSSDAQTSQRPQATNALNDGVIAHDFIQTRLAHVLNASYLNEIAQEQVGKLQREKRYKPYEHPKAPFISAKQIWTYYAPDLMKNYTKLQSLNEVSSIDALNTRLELFMAQRNFPSEYLKHFLHYQESMHKWLTPDPNLPYYDMSLFGYTSAEEWFGKHFVERVAEFIINAAKYAEARGYSVSKEQALHSLFRNCENVFRQRETQNLYGPKGVSEYFQDQLRFLGIDQTRAVALWRQVLLFRKLFYDSADSVLASPVGFSDFYKQLNEYVDIDLYQLPPFLRISTQKDLEKCMLYHQAVTADTQIGPTFSAPKSFLTAENVKKNYPQLVEKAFHLSWKKANKEELQTKVGLKQMWEWQVEDSHWNMLVERFAELGQLDASNNVQQARLDRLDALDSARRIMVDTFSREEIVNEHPEWISDAMQSQDAENEVVLIRKDGGTLPFFGISNREGFMQLLSETNQKNLEAEKQLECYSQDNVHYYSIKVLDTPNDEAIITFEKANNDGTLETLYEKHKGAYGQMLQELDVQVQLLKEKYPDLIDHTDQTKARITAYFLPYIQKEKEEKTSDSDAYRLTCERVRITKADPDALVEPTQAMTLAVESHSSIGFWPKTHLAFYTIVSKGNLPIEPSIREKVFEVRESVGDEAFCELGRMIVWKMQESARKFETAESNDSNRIT